MWSDTVSAAVNHLEGCPYLPTACPLGCVCLVGERDGQVARLERRHIPGHVRDSCPLRVVTCDFCEGEVKASEMNPHLEDCDVFPLPCPNGCAREGEDEVREVKRRDLTVHLDTHCPLQIVQCPYRDHGCREEMERRLTDTHEREFLHIHFKLSMTEMKLKLNESTLHLQHELDTANEKIADQEIQFTDSLNATKLLTDQIATLQKQNSDKDQKIASIVTVLFSLQPTFPTTGRLEWKIQGVKQRIQSYETTDSDPFYVCLYKCQCSINWNWINVGNVRVYIYIMRGDFDDKLHWPIRYKYTFVLINQRNSKDNFVYSGEITKSFLEMFPQCFKRPTDCRNEGFGDSLISNTEILGEKYCKQDSITLHISVELLASL